MNTYYIDFSGYCKINAENEKQAEEIFWEGLRSPSDTAYDAVYDIEGTEIYSINN